MPQINQSGARSQVLDRHVGLSEGCDPKGMQGMRTFMAAAALSLLFGSPAGTVEFQTPVTKQLYTCTKPGLSRVAVTTDPAPCCNGQLKCAQFLSTTGVLHTSRNPRT